MDYIDDSVVPSGFNGINIEGYTYGELRRSPIIPEILRNITNPIIKKWAEECNERNRSGFIMTKVNNEYCFDDLRVGPKVKLPSPSELQMILGDNPDSSDIRNVSYNMLREEISKQTGLDIKKAALAIGNMLDCVPHEDISGYVFMVPNWAHKWFPHKGYVSHMRSQK